MPVSQKIDVPKVLNVHTNEIYKKKLQLNKIFYVKLFATIILSWNS